MIVGIIRMLMVRDSDVAFLAGDRVYHHMAEQGVTGPHAVITRISAERPRTMDGESLYVRGRLLVDVYGTELYQWQQLKTATIKAIEAYAIDSVSMTKARQNGMTISYIELTKETDIEVSPREGQSGPAFRGTALEFMYMYTVTG